MTSEDEAVSAVERASGPDRAEIRRSFERRFTATVMARNYLSLYWSLAYGSDPDLKVGAVARRASRARTARKVRLTGFSFDGGAPPVKLLSGSARPNAMGERDGQRSEEKQSRGQKA